MTTRYDTAPIGKIEQDPSTGFLHIKDVPIARVGVFPYRRADGSIEMEAKLPDDLLADESVASANNKAITNDHPSELVNANNFKQYGKGVTAGNAHVDGDRIKVDMTITDAGLIKQISDGKEELSIGFVTEVVDHRGEYQGIKYDSMQQNIQINHVAVVNRGRAGHTVRLTGDSAIMDDSKGGNDTMETTMVMLDGKNITVAVNDADTVTQANNSNSSLQEQLKAAEAKVAELKAELEKSNGSNDANKKAADENKAKADSLDAENKKLQGQLDQFKGDSIDKMVESRLNLLAQAKPFIGDSFDITGKTEREIKVAAIKAENDSFDDKDQSDDYVNAFYDSMISLSKKPSVVGYTGTHTDGADKLTELRDSRYDLYKKFNKED